MIEKDMYNVNKSIMFNDFYNCNNIYIDLQFIKDIFLGIILLNISSEDQYNNFIEEVKKDPYRIIEDPLLLFPSIKFGNFQYNDFLENQLNHNNIFKISPLTSFERELIPYIRRIIEMKKKIDDEYIKLSLYINMYPISNLSDDLLDQFRKYFLLKYSSELEIHFLFKPITHLKKDILNFKALFIYDLKSFFDDKYYSSLFGEMKFLDKSIVAPKILYDNSLITKYELYNADLITLIKNEEIKKEFEYNDCYLNYLCQFTFIDPFNIKGEIING